MSKNIIAVLVFMVVAGVFWIMYGGVDDKKMIDNKIQTNLMEKIDTGNKMELVEGDDKMIKKEDEILVDKKGMTLYVFKKDEESISKCNGECAVKWPPLRKISALKINSHINLIKRGDGTMQVAYKGMPLYYWFKDVKAGDKTGDGIKGVWSVVKINTMSNDKMMKSGKFVKLTDINLKDLSGKIILDFSATWCPSCQQIKKDIENSLKDIPENVTIVLVDYDTNKDLRIKYGVVGQHTFVQINNVGEKINLWRGGITLEDILENIK